MASMEACRSGSQRLRTLNPCTVQDLQGTQKQIFSSSSDLPALQPCLHCGVFKGPLTKGLVSPIPRSRKILAMIHVRYAQHPDKGTDYQLSESSL